MKKCLVILFFVLSTFIPSLVFAQTDIDPDLSTLDCVNINNNLRYRDRDIYKNGEVSTLQDFLQSKGYLNIEPTGYFGLLTVKAVKDFQNANGIIPFTGYVGSITRAKIKDISCGVSVLDPSVAISVVSGNRISHSSMTVNIGDVFMILGTPKNLKETSTSDFSRAYFFNQDFGDKNECGNNQTSATGTWIITCLAKVPGSSFFYIEIYKAGQIYTSNKIYVNINPIL